jgi:hypothetical protein
MKDHVIERHHIYLEGSVEAVIKEIERAADGLLNPVIENVGWEDPDYEIHGWRPMNERELERQKKLREAERKAAAERKKRIEEKERQTLAELKAKYE